jgi:hypothetical protein
MQIDIYGHSRADKGNTHVTLSQPWESQAVKYHSQIKAPPDLSKMKIKKCNLTLFYPTIKKLYTQLSCCVQIRGSATTKGKEKEKKSSAKRFFQSTMNRKKSA